MSSSVSDESLEKKFLSVTNTQDSIQTLSLWILHHKAHHQKIVASWMKVLQKAKISHRLTLFYLANDVIQNGKRKGFAQFGNSFAEVLREATLLVRDEQIKSSVQRVFNIWEERSIYTAEFIADLNAILANTKVPATAQSKLLAEFKPEEVIERIRAVMKLELETTKKMSTINLSKLNATNAEIVSHLKDRTHGQQFKTDFDESTRCLEELIKVLNKEGKERTELILLLEQSEIYYDTQRGEAKIVANAYKNFGNRVKALQKKLEELIESLPSPVPSPCPDAPSPTTSEQELELKLPNEQAPVDDLENLENAPSPIGTPEGLNLSPPKNVESTPQPAPPQSVGNPIPTLSNFFSHDQSGMSSWLDTFTSKKPTPSSTEKNDTKKSDPSSLDNRLSSLLQSIPNLPSGLQSTIFGSSVSNSSFQDAANSPLSNKKDSSFNVESTTPIKDEYSGQNTPLQDEESTHSNQPFYGKSNSSNKPKDILKGLTNLIQSASADKSDDKKEKYKYGSDSYDDNNMSSFIQKIIPTVVSQVTLSSTAPYYNAGQPDLTSSTAVSQVTLSSTAPYYNAGQSDLTSSTAVSQVSLSTTAPYYNAGQSDLTSTTAPQVSLSSTTPYYNAGESDLASPTSVTQVTLSSTASYYDNAQSDLTLSVQATTIAQTATVNSYDTVPFHDIPVYSSKPPSQGEHMSYIPSLVPSLPQDNYNYTAETFPKPEYNSEAEHFDTSLDVNSAISDLGTESPAMDSPVASSVDQPPRSIANRRLSTLITVVTKDSPENSLPSPVCPLNDPIKSEEDRWDDIPRPDNGSWTESSIPPDNLSNSSPTEEFFIGKEAAALPPFYTSVPPPPPPPPPLPPPPVVEGNGPPNGQNYDYMNSNNVPEIRPMGKMDTRQPPRGEPNRQWNRNNWSDNRPSYPPGPPPMPCGVQDTRFFSNKRHFHPNFQPRPWGNRHRPDNFHRPYGPPPHKRFRGRGWGRNRY